MPRRRSNWAMLRTARRFLSRKIASTSYRLIWKLNSFIHLFGGAIYYDFDAYESKDYRPDPYFHLWCLVVTLVVNYATVFRFILCWFCTTPESQRAIHDVTTVIGGPKEFHLICFTIWAIHNAIISVTWYQTLSKGELLALEPLLALKYPSVARKYKLTPLMLAKLQLRHKLAVLCVFCTVFWAACCGFVFSAVLWYFKHDNNVFHPWSIAVIILTTAWGANAANNINYSFAFFYLTCCMLGMRLRAFHQSLTLLVRNAEAYKNRRLATLIKSKLDEYAEICRLVEKYNRFWRGFLGIAYYFIVLIVAILVFVVLFAPIPDISKKMLCVIMVAQGCVIAFLAYSGDIVSRMVYKPYVQFNSLQTLLTRNSQLKCKLLATIEMSAGNFTTNTVHSKRSGRMVGFSVFDQFVITDNDYINISMSLSTFLLLFLENYLY